jgi:hypothetical protein
MPKRRHNVTPHIGLLRDRIKRLHARHNDLTLLSKAKRKLGNAKQRKASVLAALEACEHAVQAAEEAISVIEELDAKVAGTDTALKELHRLDLLVRQYSTPPTVKLYGTRSESLPFWD